MKTGVTILSTDLSMPPAEVAKAAEERGFYSFYIPEHTHIPKNRLTPAPTGDDELGEDYKRTLDPYVALSFAAEATEKILLGTGVSLVLQHHPITLAKCIASLSHLSNGRFVLGAGYGWNKEEMAHHGIDYIKRREIFREWMLAMYELWKDEETGEAEKAAAQGFQGDFVEFSPSWAWPKPKNEPKNSSKPKNNRPKVLLGGAGGPKLFQHIAELADGWMPIGGAGIKEKLPVLKRAMEAAGKNPDDLEIVPFGVLPNPEKLEYYESIGVTEAVLRLPSAGRDEVLPALDEMAGL